ncbi:hypothetical protein GCM10009091_17540 [Pseudomonas brenneri]|nr:hypothetical protein GCM10009091_17540 [Pseudomonas brenneri]
MLAEHALQAFRRDSSQVAAGQFGEAVEVQQLALGEQHHEGAHGVIEQHRLNLSGRIQPWVFGDLRVADGEFREQVPNDRGCGRRGCGVGNF